MPSFLKPTQALDLYSSIIVIGVSAGLIKQQLALRNFRPRAKDHKGMVKSYQPTGANIVASQPESEEYQESNKEVNSQSTCVKFSVIVIYLLRT